MHYIDGLSVVGYLGGMLVFLEINDTRRTEGSLKYSRVAK